jgi:hypothetical protein
MHTHAICLFVRMLTIRCSAHKDQMENQRNKIKEIEDELKPGEAVVYRDFVNFYDGKGGKVPNLVLVVVFRTVVGGPLFHASLSNFASVGSKTDHRYTKDVFA